MGRGLKFVVRVPRRMRISAGWVGWSATSVERKFKFTEVLIKKRSKTEVANGYKYTSQHPGCRVLGPQTMGRERRLETSTRPDRPEVVSLEFIVARNAHLSPVCSALVS